MKKDKRGYFTKLAEDYVIPELDKRWGTNYSGRMKKSKPDLFVVKVGKNKLHLKDLLDRSAEKSKYREFFDRLEEKLEEICPKGNKARGECLLLFAWAIQIYLDLSDED